MQMFHAFCYCAVDVFVMATGYIMCRLTFKYMRLFRLWRQVVGYSIALTVLAIVLGASVKGTDWVHALFPVSTNQYWFFTQYFALFFTIPFLNRLLDNLSSKETLLLLATGLGLLSILPLCAGRDLFVTKWGYCYLWFIHLYCIGSALFKLDVVHRVRTPYAAVGLALGCTLSAAGPLIGEVLSRKIGGGARLGDLAYSYTSPMLVLEAVSLFILFAKLRISSSRVQKVIMALAPSTFIVYVVHSNGMFRRLVGWQTVFHSLSRFGVCGALFGTLVCALLIYIGIALVDSARRTIWHGCFMLEQKYVRQSYLFWARLFRR